MHTLIVIPARGGSKGIPRKNLRLLAGRPMLSYSIRTALSASFPADVVVSSEDEEIQLVAQKLGASVITRPDALSADDVTLDGVVHDALVQAERDFGKRYDIVITMQPTSPLLKVSSLQQAIELLVPPTSAASIPARAQRAETHEQSELSRSPLPRRGAGGEGFTPTGSTISDTIISVTDDRHLGWKIVDGKTVPDYTARLNRQYLPPAFRETGGFVVSSRENVTPTGRFGDRVAVFPLSEREAIDIDTYSDWALCSYYLQRKRVVIAVAGYHEIGLGHVANTLALASGILEHEIIFVTDIKSDLAYATIARNNYTIYRQQADESFTEAVLRHQPDVVINDLLDTGLDYMEALKKRVGVVINFEDLGPGAQLADLVVNAMYPEQAILPNHYFGHAYFCLRSEFLIAPSVVEIKPQVEQVLVSFGGVDPNNFTRRVLTVIEPVCRERGIEVTVILGKGYNQLASLDEFTASVNILRDVKDISSWMLRADLAFTSAGRTTFETASLGLPTIVLCQNKRETTHFFASAQYGFHNLGLGVEVRDETLAAAFSELVNSTARRKAMSDLMIGFDIRGGGRRVLNLIKQAIHDAS